jgi:hypothetical protein
VAILLTLATLVAGCSAGPVSADTGPNPADTPAPATPNTAPVTPAHTAEDVVLRISQSGGFAGPPDVPPPPPVTVYADGTMISIDRPKTNAPGPGVARLSQRQLTKPALGRLLYLAARAGLADRDHPDKPIPDAIVTVVAVRHGGRLHHSTFATFSPRPEDSPAQAQRRAAAARFVRRLSDDPRTLISSGVSEPTPVPVGRLAMSAAALAATALPERDWPVAAVDLSTLGRCTMVRGATAQQAADALAQAPSGTRWGWQAQAWRVIAAPPVDDQPDCQPAAP